MSKRTVASVVAWTILTLSAPIAVSRGQAVSPAIAEPTPATANESNDPALPPLTVTEVRLDDVLAKIKDELPDFNAIVMREPGVPSDYPKLRNLNIDHITVSQFMQFLDKSFGCLSVTQIPGKGSSLWVVHVHDDRGEAAAATTAKGIGEPVPPADSTVVAVFPLREVISNLSQQKDDKYTPKQAMDDILSLLQAALKANPSGPAANIQVHEATQMLVFKGTPQQDQLLTETLAAFAPTDQEKKTQVMEENFQRQIAKEQQKSQAELELLKRRLEDENTQCVEMRLQLQSAEQQLMKLQGAAGAATKPKE